MKQEIYTCIRTSLVIPMHKINTDVFKRSSGQKTTLVTFGSRRSNWMEHVFFSLNSLFVSGRHSFLSCCTRIFMHKIARTIALCTCLFFPLGLYSQGMRFIGDLLDISGVYGLHAYVSFECEGGANETLYTQNYAFWLPYTEIKWCFNEIYSTAIH